MCQTENKCGKDVLSSVMAKRARQMSEDKFGCPNGCGPTTYNDASTQRPNVRYGHGEGEIVSDFSDDDLGVGPLNSPATSPATSTAGSSASSPQTSPDKPTGSSDTPKKVAPVPLSLFHVWKKPCTPKSAARPSVALGKIKNKWKKEKRAPPMTRSRKAVVIPCKAISVSQCTADLISSDSD